MYTKIILTLCEKISLLLFLMFLSFNYCHKIFNTSPTESTMLQNIFNSILKPTTNSCYKSSVYIWQQVSCYNPSTVPQPRTFLHLCHIITICFLHSWFDHLTPNLKSWSLMWDCECNIWSKWDPFMVKSNARMWI